MALGNSNTFVKYCALKKKDFGTGILSSLWEAKRGIADHKFIIWSTGEQGKLLEEADRDRGSLLGYIMRGWAGIAARSADKIDISDIDTPGRKSSQVRASRE